MEKAGLESGTDPQAGISAFFQRIFCKNKSWVANFQIGFYPKSVIGHAVSVSDWGNESSGHLARFCPPPVSRYAST